MSKVPKLRFSEFRDAGDWEEKQIHEFSKVTTGNKDTQDRNENGNYPFFVRSQTIERIDTFSFDGEAILTSGDGVGVGKNFHYINGKFDFHQREYCISNFSKNVSGKFFYLYFSKHFYNRVMQLSAKNSVDSVRMPMITDMTVPLPNLEEQQKIANCLTSIDTLITAQTQKLDSLKSHKKGLMQQLFPAEGETIPKLRFPEFRDSGGWEEKSLNKITSSIFDGTHQTPRYTEKGIPFFSVENLISQKSNKYISREDHLLATNKNKPEKGDLLITRIGNIGFSAIVDWDYEFSIYVTLAVVKKSNQFDPYFLHCFLQTERYQIEIRSKSLLNAVPCKINMDELRKTKVLLASPQEQAKIANCFYCLDNLIINQVQKIESLKAHKKGLMQQLFPSTDEADE